jgi:hypothetical protein
VSTLAWTAGSWVQARLNDAGRAGGWCALGLACILAGTAGMALQLRSGVPVAEGFVAWAVAGVGMGLAYAPISLMMLRAAPAGREGWASASLNLADVLGTALGVGAGGAAVAAVARSGTARCPGSWPSPSPPRRSAPWWGRHDLAGCPHHPVAGRPPLSR